MTFVKKLQKRPGLSTLAVLAVVLFSLGGHLTWEGITHIGPGMWTYSATEDTDEHSDMLSENQYKRECYSGGAIFFLFAGLIMYGVVEVWREKDKEESSDRVTRKAGKGNMKTKILIAGLAVFIMTCLFPPWQFITDRYGNHAPAGYSLIFAPPDAGSNEGVQLDFGRLFIEWAALAAITGTVWIFVARPSWTRDKEVKRSGRFIPPPGNPEN